MAGAMITIDIEGMPAVLRALDRLMERGDDVTPALQDIGEHLLISHHERFASEMAPDGTPWAPLSPQYAERKQKKSAGGLLVLDDLLRGTLRWQIAGNELQLGTDRVYGALHQLGGTGDMAPGPAAVPARPYLGLDADDETAVIDILADHLLAGLGR